MTEPLLILLTYEFWKIGMGISMRIVATVAILIALTQLVWMLYRYVTDATMLEREAREGKGYKYKRSRFIFCGDPSAFVPDPWPGGMTDFDEVAQFFGVIFVYFLIGLLFSFLWPLSLLYIITHGSLLLIRAAIRFKRKVNKALETKANKDHNHDGKYVKK